MPRPRVFITRLIPEAGFACLARAGLAARLHPGPRPPSEDELCAAAAGHDAVICQLGDRIDRAVLQAAAHRCRIFANCAVGYDNIDLAAAAGLGIIITNTPGVLTEATADLTWALLLAAARRLGEAERTLRAGAWRGWAMLDFLGADVHGRTLGIVGAGRIGTAVARRAAGFSMPLLYASRGPSPAIEALGATRRGLHDLLREADVVSLHVPLTPETRRLIDARALAGMKPGAILINTARGDVVDVEALIDALRAGRLAAAGLDVYPAEPRVPAALLDMENVVLLPHIGSATLSARSRMALRAAENVAAVLRGRPPLDPVRA
jgi:glyoxylate reductase